MEHEPSYWHERLVDRPYSPLKALRLKGPGAFKKGRQIVDRLDAEETLGVIKGPTRRRPSVIVPEASFERLTRVLSEEGIDFVETAAVPISLLPVEDQRRFRRPR